MFVSGARCGRFCRSLGYATAVIDRCIRNAYCGGQRVRPIAIETVQIALEQSFDTAPLDRGITRGYIGASG